ncbi:AMP-binding protein [Actinoplanes sp. NPDC049265]|uniref:AMP-binding protein n=1 Tax=Actinoplanes sp. NPDC049265 TaxID=3363902 RepID=UPI00371F973A
MSSWYGRPAPPATIHGTVARVARRCPGRTALISGRHHISYARLMDRSGRVAHHLRNRGVRPGDVVPVTARRSADLAVVLLGVLRAGAAYAVLDVRWPAGRLHGLVTAMRAPVVLADGPGSAALDEAGCDHLAFADLEHTGGPAGSLPDVTPDACATVFWTSGSTGRAKAVLSPHRATTRLFTPEPFIRFGPAPVMVNAAAVAWDAFTLELWGMLLLGGTALVHEDDLLTPPALRGYIKDHGATHLFLTPALFDVLAGGDLDCLAGLRALLLGGDRPPPENCRRLLDTHPDIELYNGYGPVESCVFATTRRITIEDTGGPGGVPAGEPVPGTEIHIVRDGVTVAPGETGEVAIGGTGVALGYLDDAAATEAAFTGIVAGARTVPVYLTGDRGHLDPSGALHFAGRADAQLKIAGHRIEPAEVEAAARAAGAGRCVVSAIPDRSGTPRIILFAERSTDAPNNAEQTARTVNDAEQTARTVNDAEQTARTVNDAAQIAGAVNDAEFRARLAAVLPAYMMPSHIHFVDTIPLLDNTKVDRRALAARFGYPH